MSKAVTSPVSLIVSAFAPVSDIREAVTPELRPLPEETVILLLDLAEGKQRLGGSILGQTYSTMGTEAPDLENPELLKKLLRVPAEKLGRGAGVP